MSEIGKKLRLVRLMRHRPGRLLCVAFDHGMQVGTVPGNEDPARMLDLIAQSPADAVILNPGMLLRHGQRLAGGPAVILRIDQTTAWRHGTPSGYRDTHSRLVATVEDAVALGADAVITYLFTCNNRPEEETRSFEICGEVASACRRFGLVHVIEAMAARGGFAKADDRQTVLMNCRIAGELGADLIKTDWCGKDGLRAAAATATAPVAVAGGPALESEAALDDFARDAIEAGACGLMFGRNILTRQDPAAVLRRLAAVVHSG